MKLFKTLLSAAIALLFGSGAVMAEEGAYVLNHTVKDIHGQEVNLEQYKGKVVLIVNVASKCGLTPQYEELQKIYAKYKDQDFIILGFPANNFMGQEPGSNEEILTFCTSNYNVEFDMFSRISVKGDDIDPLYKQLTSASDNSPYDGDIAWNFTKFLINKEGKVVARFEPKTSPSEEIVIETIEAELKK